MAETTESIILRMGLDQTQVEQGLLKMRARQEVEAAKTKAIWAESDRARAVEEQIALDASFKRYEANLAKKKTADDIYFAERKAKIELQAEVESSVIVSSGIVPAGFKSQIAAAGAGALGGAALAKGAAEAARATHGFAGILRETGVLFREFFRGNFSRMLGSASILVGLLRAWPIALGLTAVTGISELLGGPGVFKTYRAYKEAGESGKGVEGATTGASETLRSEIEKLQRAGAIDDKQATGLLRQLKGGDIFGVFSAVNPMLRGGTADELEKRATVIKEIQRLAAQGQKEALDVQREGMSHAERLNSLEQERNDLGYDMARMHTDTLEYAQDYLKYAQLTRDVEKEQNDIVKEAKELQKQYDEQRKNFFKISGEASQLDVEAPSIEQLAGRDFSENLASAYGAPKWKRIGRRWYKIGGQFDLSAGDGPFAGIAQQAELSKYQEMWDIIHGNAQFGFNPATGRNELIGGQAFIDRQQRMAAENLLSAAGLDTPEMKLSQMRQDLMAINENIYDILQAASKDGIVLKDKQ